MARTTIDELLADARRGLRRLEPREAAAAVDDGALLVDLRSGDEREREGVIPAALHVPRSVLEWRADPDSEYCNPAVAVPHAHLILFCAEGYSSSLAAASLQRIGFVNATDMVGGFAAWKAAGLPVHAASATVAELPGMGLPDP
jgi:rhodanese-related sulfurtransferase